MKLKSNNSKIHRAVFPEHQLLQLPVRIDQLPREGEQAVNINTKVMKLKKVHLLSLCEDRSRQKNKGVCQNWHTFFYAQGPDFHKLGLCYYLKIMYL